MNSKKLSRDEKFQRIINEGRSLFVKDGLGMSMRELAEKAGFKAVSSLYRYIANKRELWFAVVNQDAEDFNTQLEHEMLNPDFVTNQAILKAMIELLLQFSRDNFDKFKVLFLMEPPPSDMVTGKFEKHHNPKIYQNFLIIIQRGVQAKEFKEENVIMMVGVVWSMMMGAAISLSPLYDFMSEKIMPTEIRTQLGKDPRILLHQEIINTIVNLYYV